MNILGNRIGVAVDRIDDAPLSLRALNYVADMAYVCLATTESALRRGYVEVVRNRLSSRLDSAKPVEHGFVNAVLGILNATEETEKNRLEYLGTSELRELLAILDQLQSVVARKGRPIDSATREKTNRWLAQFPPPASQREREPGRLMIVTMPMESAASSFRTADDDF